MLRKLVVAIAAAGLVNSGTVFGLGLGEISLDSSLVNH